MAKAVLTWNANSESDLAGYKIYRGVNGAALTLLAQVPKVVTYTDDPLPTIDGNITYAISAFDTSGNESPKTAPVTKVVNTVPPVAPSGLVVVIE